jgi:hypothetical protein
MIMGDGRCSVAERPSKALDNNDMIEPLLDRHPERKEEHKQVFDDTVDFGTEGTSIASPLSTSEQDSVSSVTSPYTEIKHIDNTRLTYIPINLECGNQVYCAPDVLSNYPMILRSVQADLAHILKILPWSVHNLVKRTKIWINASYSYGPRDDPRVLRHSTAHHEEGWLVDCARDRPEKARSIEIYSCFDFERMRLHWNGCGLLLHEFCHLIHQFCLGLDHPVVERLYVEAYKSGRYDKILRRDWAGKDVDFDMAYGMVDFKEFFAEMSVAYLSNGYHDLDRANKAVMEACCPPLLEPNVTKRILRNHDLEDNPYRDESDNADSFWSSLFRKDGSLFLLRGSVPKLRMIDPIWQEAAIGRGCRDIIPCNKFYPFTRGQLRQHDPELYIAMRNLWSEIVMYDDPEEELSCCLKLAILLPSSGW